MTQFNKYIGLPWVAGASGPDAFDCWGFVRYVLKHEFGHNVPQVNVNANNLRDVLTAFKQDLAFQSFVEVFNPQNGDVVLLRQANNPAHCGLWLNIDGGGILHCVRGTGVVFQNKASIKSNGWFIHSYYRVKEN